MRNLILRFFINAAAIGIIVSGILPGIRITGNTLPTLVVVAVIFGLINTLVKPIIQLLTCPIVLLTLGLFLFIINGAMLYVTAFLSDVVARNVGVGGTLIIDNLLWAVVGAVVVTLVSIILERVLGVNEPRVVVKRVEIHEVAARTRSRADEDWDAALRGDLGGFGEDVIDPKTGKPR
jgi:putative membrane protein